MMWGNFYFFIFIVLNHVLHISCYIGPVIAIAHSISKTKEKQRENEGGGNRRKTRENPRIENRENERDI